MNEKAIQKENRIEWIDFARGAGILLVLLGHTTFLPLIPKGYIYSFHMPLFFVLSGYVFVCKSTFKEFTVKRLKSLVLPYFSFLLVYFVAFTFKCLILHEPEKFDRSITGLAIQKTGYTYAIWFFIVLFVTEIIFYVIAKYVTKQYLLFGIIVLMVAIDVAYFKLIDKSLPFQLQICFTALPFYAFGYLLKNIKLIDKMNKLAYVYMFLLAIISVSLFVVKCKFYNPYTSLTSNHYGNFVIFYSLAVSTVLLILLASSKIRELKVINYIGKNSIVIFSLHQPLVTLPLNLLVVKVVGKDYMNRFSFIENILLSIAELIITMAILLIVNSVINHTFLRVFIGKTKK